MHADNFIIKIKLTKKFLVVINHSNQEVEKKLGDIGNFEFDLFFIRGSLGEITWFVYGHKTKKKTRALHYLFLNR